MTRFSEFTKPVTLLYWIESVLALGSKFAGVEIWERERERERMREIVR